jgi:hypothetical protein
MTTKTRIFFLTCLVVIVCLLCLPGLSAAANDTASIPLEPGPVIIETTPTEKPVTEVTTEPTTRPTTEPTTIRTTEPTTIPTTEPTTVRTTEPTTVPTTEIPTTSMTIGGGKGWIDVYCNVDGGTVYFDGTPEGTIAGGILSVEVSVTGTPVKTITVTKSGYTTWTGELSHMPENDAHVAVYSTLNPVVTTQTTVTPVSPGSIYAQSNPAGAAIYMNGVLQGYSPISMPDLAPGTYSMKATLSGYTPDTTLIQVYSGQTASYYPTLQRSPNPNRDTGTVYITSSPNSASVYVDGNYYGKTPLTVTLYPGSHTIMLRMSGYSDYTTTVWVNANQAQNLPVTMTTAIFGTVVISSLPGAAVYMDSNYAGQINSGGSLTLSSVPSGNHIFKITASGYSTWMNTVYIQANMVNSISAPLTKTGTNPTPAQGTGGLDIASSPTGAETYVDDLFRGYSPVTLTDLAVGQHTVVLKAAGYLDYTGTAAVSTGVTTPLAITLTPAPTQTPTKSPGFETGIAIAGLLALAGIIGICRRRN